MKTTAYNVAHLGQVFTPSKIVSQMLSLRKNRGCVLEPSAGDGAFLKRLEKEAVGIEYDKKISAISGAVNIDFFAYKTAQKFDTIIGNPPYVTYKAIEKSTQKILPMERFDKRSNLYLFFIDRCIDFLNDKGEIIFITPRDFLKATSSKKLNERLYNEGAFTHYYELGDTSIFKGYTPNCAIWRWEKGRSDKRLQTGGTFMCVNGQICFTAEKTQQILGDFFDVKVGAVSGADTIFTSPKGDTEFVCSTTRKDRSLRKMIYNRFDESLLPHKQMLINRRIKKFDEHNWWQWGRKYYETEGERIYVNCKTRHTKPFFKSEVQAYDGAMLALIPREDIYINKAVEKLNKTNWEKLGFVCDGRLMLTQRSLFYMPFEL